MSVQKISHPESRSQDLIRIEKKEKKEKEKKAAKEEKAAKEKVKQNKKAAKEKIKQNKKSAKEKSERKKQYASSNKKINNSINKENKYYKNNEEKAKYKTALIEFNAHYTEGLTKICSKCKISKPFYVFNKNDCGEGAIFRSDHTRNRRPECCACTVKNYNNEKTSKAAAKKNGISYIPGTPCRLCNKLPYKGNPICYDRSHEGDYVFRGFLCSTCNRSLGAMGDNARTLCRALKYVNETEKLSKEQIINLIFSI